MSLKPFRDTEEFLSRFDLNVLPRYENVTHLTDCRAGFSITRPYPRNLLFVPARTAAGHDDTVVMIHVIYRHPDEEPVDLSHVPIKLGATSHSLYLRTHLDFNYSDPDSPTKESVRACRASVGPVPLESSGEYVFDHGSDTFRNTKGIALTGREALDRFFQEHCNTAHRLWGIPIRTRRGIRNFTAASADRVEILLVSFLRLFCGQSITKKPEALLERKAYKPEDLKPSSDRLAIRGIPVTLHSIFWSAALVIIFWAGLELFDRSDTLIVRLFSNVVVVPFIFIILLILIDRVLPRVLIPMLNALNRLATRLRFPMLDD